MKFSWHHGRLFLKTRQYKWENKTGRTHKYSDKCTSHAAQVEPTKCWSRIHLCPAVTLPVMNYISYEDCTRGCFENETSSPLAYPEYGGGCGGSVCRTSRHRRRGRCWISTLALAHPLQPLMYCHFQCWLGCYNSYGRVEKHRSREVLHDELLINTVWFQKAHDFDDKLRKQISGLFNNQPAI